jgi:hypothetical protein
MEQLLSDIYVQNWNYIYDTSDSEQQIQHFNSIIRWLLEIHAPLCEYVKRIIVNPWYNCDVEPVIVERDIAYRFWKHQKTPADRTRYKIQKKKVNYIVRKAKRLYIGRLLDPCQPVRRLWR